MTSVSFRDGVAHVVGSPLDTAQSGVIIIGVLYGTAKRDFNVGK
jgi:hypothetical protein